MAIDDGVELLTERCAREGLTFPPAADPAEVAALQAMVAPLELPADYQRLLTRMDPGRCPLEGMPALSDLGFVAEGYAMDREDAFTPRILLTIAYTSHNWLAVELAGDGFDGGELYAWAPGEDFGHVAGGVAGYLTGLAEAAAHPTNDGGARLAVDFDGDRPRGDHIGYDARTWPAHWRAAEGLSDGDMAVRGPTGTVSDFLSIPAESRPSATLHVTVRGLMGTSGYSIATAEDDSGSITLLWPSERHVAGVVQGQSFEVEIRRDPTMTRDRTSEQRLAELRARVSMLLQEGDVEEARLASLDGDMPGLIARTMTDYEAEVTSARRLS